MHQQVAVSGWERVAMGIERVRERLLRVTRLLNEAAIPYAVLGGNAVAEWVGRVDEGAVRFTKDVDVLIRRADLPRVVAELERAGFVYREFQGVCMLLDDADASSKGAARLFFSGEKFRSNDVCVAPAVDESEPSSDGYFSVLSLDALVRTKLVANRRIDRTHLRDLLDVGLLDASWLDHLPPELQPRFQALLDTPDG